MNEPPANTRSDVLKNLAKLIVKVNPKDFARVAIDGIDAAGKTRLADELAVRRPGRESTAPCPSRQTSCGWPGQEGDQAHLRGLGR